MKFNKSYAFDEVFKNNEIIFQSIIDMLFRQESVAIGGITEDDMSDIFKLRLERIDTMSIDYSRDPKPVIVFKLLEKKKTSDSESISGFMKNKYKIYFSLESMKVIIGSR